ncbi:MAG: YchJ family metal-binding protein [Steroidobacteraceae bacterium]
MTRADPNTPMGCPCGRPAAYPQCCGRWHHGPMRLQATDAESLMRSRYSAYARGEIPYLLDTWHPQTRPARLESTPPDMHWLGLDVRRHVQLDENHATVEFVALSKRGGRASRLHEISRFERLGGRWLYIDGVNAKPR